MFYGMNAWFLATLVMGALWWVAIAAHPSWMKLPAEAGARAYVAAWSRGGPVLAVLTLFSVGLGFAAAGSEPDMKWAIGAGFMLSAFVFTLVFMAKPGHALRDAPADAHAVLRTWGRLHLIRCVLASVGVFFFIWAAH